MSEHVATINSYLAQWLKKRIEVPSVLEACRYALFPGGKLIRSHFSLSVAQDLGVNSTILIPAAAAVELLHNASLAHDDLPALDNDDERRGKPSLHKRYGEAHALLVGDLLALGAIEIALESELEPEEHLTVTKVLAKAYVDVCLGQVLDISPLAARGALLTLHTLKTGSLFRAAAAIGAVKHSKNVQLFEIIQELGEAIGVAFQILDDLIDALPEKGRAISSDRKLDKVTFLTGEYRELLEEVSAVHDKVSNLLTSIHDTYGYKLPTTRVIVDGLLLRLKEVAGNVSEI